MERDGGRLSWKGMGVDYHGKGMGVDYHGKGWG